MVLFLLLMPITVLLALRAQAQVRDFNKARGLYIDSEQFVHTRDYPRAVENLEEAVRLCPDLISAWDSLAWCYYAQNQREKAYATLKQACQLHPSNGFLARQLGCMYLLDDKLDDAVAALEQAEKVDPTDPLIAKFKEKALHKRSKAP